MKIIGLDIGYSNLKLAIGEVGQTPTEFLLPSGAASEDRLPHGIRLGEEGIRVQLDSECWRIGLPHGRFDQASRSLHQNYTDSSAYKALFYGALLMAGHDHVDKIVTGLPVSIWQDATIRSQLAEQLIGVHQVVTSRRVVVDSVDVIPQPLGAYLDRLWNAVSDTQVLSEGRVLIVDPGYFSVDWVVIEQGALRQSGSGSSLDAMSLLIREAAEEIYLDRQGKVSSETLEDALRNGKGEIFLFGETISLDPYLKKASSRVADQAMDQLQESIRRETGSIDVVILAGGGAAHYKASVRDRFRKSKVMMADCPERANARGFFYFGEM